MKQNDIQLGMVLLFQLLLGVITDPGTLKGVPNCVAGRAHWPQAPGSYFRYWYLGTKAHLAFCHGRAKFDSNVWRICSDAQSCLIFCDPMDCSPPGSFIHRISQTRVLEWVAISYLPHPGIEPGSPALQAILYQLSHQGTFNLFLYVSGETC